VSNIPAGAWQQGRYMHTQWFLVGTSQKHWYGSCHSCSSCSAHRHLDNSYTRTRAQLQKSTSIVSAMKITIIQTQLYLCHYTCNENAKVLSQSRSNVHILYPVFTHIPHTRNKRAICSLFRPLVELLHLQYMVLPTPPPNLAY